MLRECTGSTSTQEMVLCLYSFLSKNHRGKRILEHINRGDLRLAGSGNRGSIIQCPSDQSLKQRVIDNCSSFLNDILPSKSEFRAPILFYLAKGIPPKRASEILNVNHDLIKRVQSQTVINHRLLSHRKQTTGTSHVQSYEIILLHQFLIHNYPPPSNEPPRKDGKTVFVFDKTIDEVYIEWLVEVDEHNFSIFSHLNEQELGRYQSLIERDCFEQANREVKMIPNRCLKTFRKMILNWHVVQKSTDFFWSRCVLCHDNKFMSKNGDHWIRKVVRSWKNDNICC